MAVAIAPTELRERAKAGVRRVHDDAALFAETLLQRHLWSKQREVLDAISTHERVAVASCHSVGKSMLAACALLWFLYTRAPARIVTTAPTWRQVEKVIWQYVAREHGRLPEELRNLGECLQTRLVLGIGHEAFGQSTDKPDAFQGIHAPHIMLIVDEAAGVSDEIFEAAATLGAGGEYRELLIGNPTSGEGKFFRAFNNADLGYTTLRIDALDTPNFTGEKCPPSLLRELIQPAQVERWRADWGEDSPAYLSRVHAQFPSADELAVIAPLAWFEKAQRRAPAPLPSDTVQMGVDVARFGTDRSCIAEAVGANLQTITSYQGCDTTTLAGHVRDRATALQQKTGKHVRVCIDETGVGAGVVDQCKKHNSASITYIGVNFGAAAQDAGRFVNLRAEMYWGLRELMRQGNNEPDLCVTATGAEAERLGAQLSSVRYVYNSREKVQVESKEDMRKRGMSSPDEADAAIMALGYKRGSGGGTSRLASATAPPRSIIATR